MLRLTTYRRAHDFLAAAGAWLAEREAEHNLMLGIAGDLADDADADADADARPYFAVIADEGTPVAVAMRWPPWNLLLSEVDDPMALRLLADELAGVDLPGVTGPPDAVDHFAAAWTTHHDGRAEPLMEERIYRLSRVTPPSSVAGSARRATDGDRALLRRWMVDFHLEALPEQDAERVAGMVDAWDPGGQRQFWLWEAAGRPVSIVSAHSPTPHGIRIGPVYTAPADRGRGYASALTAFVSQWNLDQGRRFCFLYTDLANATANHVYIAIGYEPVTDARMVRFST